MYKEALGSKEALKLFSLLKNFPDFYLAGGTALALQIGHRVSQDFDLFLQDFISKEFLGKVKKVFSGFDVQDSVNNTEELTIFIDGLKLSFLRYPFPVIGKLEEHEGVKLLSIKEIAATKAYVIGRRGSFKDYVDIYFILSEGHATLNEIIEVAEKKYGDEFNGRLFLEQLIYLKDIEDTKIAFLKGSVTKDEIEKFFVEKVKEIKL